MATIQLQIVTPKAAVFTETVSSVALPGELGEMEVMPGHIPLVTLVHPGHLVANVVGSGGRSFAVSHGYAEILPHAVRVLVDTCEGADEIDIAQARSRVADLEQLLGEHGSRTPEEMSTHARELSKEQARLAVVEIATGKK